ncbi:MAG: CYTH domain-containing protein [Clostridia bacterium]|nr:CYTH domain-containing protein [Clostridia bacterium]
MEIELKYTVPDQETAEKLCKTEVFKKFGKVDSETETEMKATYFDTEDRVLSGVDAAFRIRKEGEAYVATLKWGGRQENGLHEREELNIQLDTCCEERTPSLEVFKESQKGRELMELVGDKPLAPLIETDFTRHAMRLDTGKVICEASMDMGKIITSAGDLDIMELELELFSGDVEALKSLGETLSKKLKLEPGTRSKFGRGMELLKEAKNNNI